MRPILFSLFLLFLSSPCFSGDKEELSQLLDDFLQGASIDDAAMHDRFWSEDLIYTSSAGLRFGKSTIMEALVAASSSAEEPAEHSTRYWAEDQQIVLYGDMAVVAFRLMAESREAGANELSQSEYFNTGTFQKRQGQWRAVAWQATRIAKDSE